MDNKAFSYHLALVDPAAVDTQTISDFIINTQVPKHFRENLLNRCT